MESLILVAMIPIMIGYLFLLTWPVLVLAYAGIHIGWVHLRPRPRLRLVPDMVILGAPKGREVINLNPGQICPVEILRERISKYGS